MIKKCFGKSWSQDFQINARLTEGDMIIKNDKLIADISNNNFADITKTLQKQNWRSIQILMVSLYYITDFF